MNSSIQRGVGEKRAYEIDRAEDSLKKVGETSENGEESQTFGEELK